MRVMGYSSNVLTLLQIPVQGNVVPWYAGSHLLSLAKLF